MVIKQVVNLMPSHLVTIIVLVKEMIVLIIITVHHLAKRNVLMMIIQKIIKKIKSDQLKHTQ